MQQLSDTNLDKLQIYFEIDGDTEVAKFHTIGKLHEHFMTAAVKKKGAKPVFCMAGVSIMLFKYPKKYRFIVFNLPMLYYLERRCL